MNLIADRRFIATHVLLPALAFSLLWTIAENTRLDLAVADLWYRIQGGSWAWRDGFVSYQLIHHYGKELIITIGLAVITLFALSFRLQPLRAWRRPLGYLLLCMILLPATVAEIKSISPAPCPWDISVFGGDEGYRHIGSYSFGPTEAGHCFPSGHASGGFALLAMYFAMLGRTRRAGRWLIPGLLVGWTFALGQQSRGAHFFSHDLWTISFIWFGALLLFFLVRPDRDPPAEQTMPTKSTLERSTGR